MASNLVTKATLHPLDYVMVGLLLIVSLVIGLIGGLRGRKNQTRQEYLLGNRQMGTFSVALSMFATIVSAVSVIGIPAEIYNNGFVFFLYPIGFTLTYIIGLFTLVPLFYEIQVTSIYEYLQMRFKSNAVRAFGVFLGMLWQIVYSGIALFSPALAIRAAVGLPMWVSTVGMGLVATAYTAFGGLRSVIWTDVFQAVILAIGLCAVIIKGLMEMKSFSEIWRLNNIGKRIHFETSADPRIVNTVWTHTIANAFGFLVTIFNQAVTQRISSVKSLRAARLVFLLNIPIMAAFMLLLCFTGALIYAYFHSIGCDPLGSGFIRNINQIMPYFVFHILGSAPGMSGLFLTAMFSGCLSTLSSLISALSVNTVEDLLKYPLQKYQVPESTITLIAKISVCIYGIMAVGLAYAAESFPGTVVQTTVSITGACGGPVVGMFILGGIFPWTNKYGALSGGLTALVVNIWLTIGRMLYGSIPQHLPPAPIDNCETTMFSNSSVFELNNSVNYAIAKNISEESTIGAPRTSVYDISYFWYGGISLLVVQIVGAAISRLTASLDSGTEDQRLIFPFARKLWKQSLDAKRNDIGYKGVNLKLPDPDVVDDSRDARDYIKPETVL